jgi:signal transduction histidine kinase
VFRRLRLPGKLVLAAVPLIVALSAVSALYVAAAFDEAAAERQAAELSVVLSEVRDAVDAVVEESATGPASAPATDARIARLRTSVGAVDAPPLVRQLDSALRRLDQARAAEGPRHTLYDQVAGDLLAVASLVPTEIANPESARALQGVAAIGRARQVATVQERIVMGAPLSEADSTVFELIRSHQADFTQWVDLFHTVASSEARTIFAQSGAPVAIGGVSTQVNRLLAVDDSAPAISESDWRRLLDERSAALATFEERLIATVQSAAGVAADRATATAWIVVAIAAGALMLAAVMTAFISRSIVRRVRSVTERAQHVAQEQLPALVEALRDPGEDTALPTIPPIRDRGADEVGDLARSFSAMQSTLEHVAAQQVETLRKGVAEMFVTLARRNRSLIDRQLALIDELEADEEDPAALSDFYRLDHMATRMRRNAESLLVLAGSEPPRTWRTPLGIDDVVRAAIGEIEDYRRVDVLTLESVRLKGSVVADLSHLLSELLENAAQFSPPQTRVRVSGHFHEEGYLLTVSDRGVGVPQARIGELNRLLERPPVIGLALEPTLGLYVVAMLAKRHGIQVRLVPGAPGVSAKLLIPPALYDEPAEVDQRPPDSTRVPTEGRHRPRPETDGAHRRQKPAGPVESTPAPSPRWGPPSNVRPMPSALVEPVLESPAIAMEPPAPSPPPTVEPVAVAQTGVPQQDRGLGTLPVRNPGGSYTADPRSERPVTQPGRTPDAVRSNLGAFQTGLEAGRRHATEGGEE